MVANGVFSLLSPSGHASLHIDLWVSLSRLKMWANNGKTAMIKKQIVITPDLFLNLKKEKRFIFNMVNLKKRKKK
jgi:hypothetical protein